MIALGNPHAIARDGEVSASWGIVSNLRRKVAPRPAVGSTPIKLHHFGTLIQTDARLNLGTSGGALINLRGELVGLTTALAAIAGYEKSAGYAIAVDSVFRRVVDKLKQGREVEYGFLGVSPSDLTVYQRRRGARGVQIDAVVNGTPAAGVLRTGDQVTHIDGSAIHTAGDLMLAVGKLDAGAAVRLNVGALGPSSSVSCPPDQEPHRRRQGGDDTGTELAWAACRIPGGAASASRGLRNPVRMCGDFGSGRGQSGRGRRIGSGDAD